MSERSPADRNDEPIRSPLTGIVGMFSIPVLTLLAAMAALGLSVWAILVWARTSRMVGAPHRLFATRPNERQKDLSELVFDLAMRVQHLTEELNELKRSQGQPPIRPHPTQSMGTPTSSVFHDTKSDRHRSTANGGEPIAASRTKREPAGEPSDGYRKYEEVDAFSFRDGPMTNLDPVLSQYRAILRARGPEAMNEFVAAYRPSKLSIENGSLVSGAEGDPDYIWLVKLPHWGDSGVVLPGGDAIRNWATNFQPSGGRLARNLFGRAYDVEPNDVLEIVEPATVRAVGGRYTITGKGRMRGA